MTGVEPDALFGANNVVSPDDLQQQLDDLDTGLWVHPHRLAASKPARKRDPDPRGTHEPTPAHLDGECQRARPQPWGAKRAYTFLGLGAPPSSKGAGTWLAGLQGHRES